MKTRQAKPKRGGDRKTSMEKESGAQRAPKIAKKDLERAKHFLESNTIGRRFQAAEHALTLLIKDQLPRLKQYVFNSSFDLRRISDKDSFEDLLGRQDNLSGLLHESSSCGNIKVHFEKEQLRIMLFYEKDLSKNEALLFSQSFGSVIAVTYAALGLDMTGITSVQKTATDTI